jgi:hypothetical protein
MAKAKAAARKRVRKLVPDGNVRAAEGLGVTDDGVLVKTAKDAKMEVAPWEYVTRTAEISVPEGHPFFSGFPLPPRSRTERVTSWLLRNADRILVTLALVVAFTAGWFLSQVWNGVLVSDSCRDHAAFEMLGQIYSCALGK